MKLFERFGDKGFHSSIITTFGIDFEAYENIALYRLLGSGCRNNTLIIDKQMLTIALDGTSTLPEYAGRHYTVSGVEAKGVFHPKIILQLGRKEARLIVGSANMTASGIAGNLELVGSITARPEDLGERQLIASAWNYVTSLLDTQQEAISHQLSWIRMRTRWLTETEPTDLAVELADKSLAAFLPSNIDIGIGERFVALLQEQKINRLIILSPYWDEELNAIKYLSDQLNPKEIIILIDKDKQLFPSESLKNLPYVKVLDLKKFAQGRFVHAKAIIAQTDSYDHVLYGSANCTVAALGRANYAGSNEEACLYRRMPANSVLGALQLDAMILTASPISASDLPTFHQDNSIPIEEAVKRFPGRFESHSGRLFWWPPKSTSIEETHLELLGLTGKVLSLKLSPLTAMVDGPLRFIISEAEESPSFARLRFKDGVTSAPAVITQVDEIQDFVREIRGKKAEQAAVRLEMETEEGTWLLEVLDNFEAAEIEMQNQTNLPISHQKNITNPLEQETVYKKLAYESFIAGRKSSLHQNAISRLSTIGSEQSLVRAFLNRILAIADAKKISPNQAMIEEEIRQSQQLGDETSQGGLSIDADNATLLQNKERQKTEKEIQKEIQIAKAKKVEEIRDQITKAVVKFTNRVSESAQKNNITSFDVLRLRSILMIVAAAGWSDSNARKTQLQVLPLESPHINLVGGDYSWPGVLGKVLYSFFGGNNPAILSLHIDASHEQIPNDILEGWATCFWAANACLVTAYANPTLNKTSSRIESLRNKIYLMTALTPDELKSQSIIKVIEGLNNRFCDRLGIAVEATLAEHERQLRKMNGD